MRSSHIVGSALGSLILLSGPALAAGAPQKEMPPEPDKLVQRMCDYLKSLNRFSYRAEVSDDRVYAGGEKIQYAFELETFVERPNQLRVNAEGDRVNQQFFYDGKTLTLYNPADQVYATVEAPPEIEEALEKADHDLKLRVALTDLASPKLCEHLAKGQRHAFYVGPSRVRGVPTDHLAFDRNDIQFQLWIETGPQPLPRKIVITQKNLLASPQWIAILQDWKVSPSLKPELFSFKAPPGAQKIKFAPALLPVAPAPVVPPTKTGG